MTHLKFNVIGGASAASAASQVIKIEICDIYNNRYKNVKFDH